MYTKESLAGLRQKIDLVELIGAFHPLKRAGATYKACCPFHEERTPSFYVRPGDTHYHCYGCGAHGDAIAFVMQDQGMSFAEAVDFLAQRYHVMLEKVVGSREQESHRHLHTLLGLVTEIGQYHLLHTTAGHAALHYLYSRGMTLEMIRYFHLGYWDPEQMLPLLQQAGWKQRDFEAAGLCTNRGYLYFNDRILIPIRNATGSVVGFSARKWHAETKGGKYVNTPETECFKKHRLLFGLDLCRRRIARERRAILVEGQLDALTLIWSGWNQTLAVQGTAFGEGHLQELKHLGVQEVWLLFDADSAGQQATVKVGELLMGQAIQVRVGQLPEGCDPHDFIHAQGPFALARVLEEAQGYLAFRVALWRAEGRLQDPAAKAQVVQECVELVKSWQDPILIHESLKQAAQLFEVPPAMLGVGAPPRRQKLPPPPAPSTPASMQSALDADLLRWLLRLGGEEHRQLVAAVQQVITVDHLLDPRAKQLFPLLCSSQAEGGSVDLIELAVCADEPHIAHYIDQLLRKRMPKDRGVDLLQTTVQRLLERKWLQECEQLHHQLQQAASSGGDSDAATFDLARQYAELRTSPPKFQPVLSLPVA